jgi:hypothetical protein
MCVDCWLIHNAQNFTKLKWKYDIDYASAYIILTWSVYTI